MEQKQVDILIQNGVVIPMDGNYYPSGFVAIKGQQIAAVGPMEECDGYTAHKCVDAAGRVVLPGFVNAHTHMGLGFQRGCADDIKLYEFLDRTFQPGIDASEEVIYYYTMLGAAEMIRSGYTTVADSMHHLPGTVRGITETGMRGKLTPVIVDFNDETRAAGLIRMMSDLYEQYNGVADGRVLVDYDIHAPYTCTETLMRGIKEAAQAHHADIQIHIAENMEEIEDIRKRAGKTPMEYLESLGILGPDILAGHFVQVTDRDMDMAKDYGIRVSHNPGSNMKLASGFCPVQKLLDRNIPVGLGTDSCVTNNKLDAFDTMKLTALIHKGYNNDATQLPAQKVLELTTVGGAAAVGLSDKIGTLEPGKLADIVIVKYAGTPHMVPWSPGSQQNTVSHLVYSASACDVETVLIDGKMVMENQVMCLFDEARIIEEAQEIGLRELKKAKLL